jgi:F-type H+-transporting ATPase subunit gamma
VEEYLGVVGPRSAFSIASTAGRKLVDGFLADDYDEVYVIYSKFLSMAKQVPTVSNCCRFPPSKRRKRKARGCALPGRTHL